MSRKERDVDGGEFNSHADEGMAAGQIAGDQEFVVAETAIGGLHIVQGGAEFAAWVGLDAGVRSRQIPDSSGFPIRLTGIVTG